MTALRWPNMKLSIRMSHTGKTTCDEDAARSSWYTAPDVRAMPRFRILFGSRRQFSPSPANSGRPRFLGQVTHACQDGKDSHGGS